METLLGKREQQCICHFSRKFFYLKYALERKKTRRKYPKHQIRNLKKKKTQCYKKKRSCVTFQGWILSTFKSWGSNTCLILINFNFWFDLKNLWEEGVNKADGKRLSDSKVRWEVFLQNGGDSHQWERLWRGWRSNSFLIFYWETLQQHAEWGFIVWFAAESCWQCGWQNLSVLSHSNSLVLTLHGKAVCFAKK